MNEKVDIRIFLPEALCHPRIRLPSSPQCSFGFFSYLFVQWWENGTYMVAHKSEVNLHNQLPSISAFFIVGQSAHKNK